MTLRPPLPLALAAALALGGCDSSPSLAPPAPPIIDAKQPARQPGARDTGSLAQRQAAFLNRLREADPQQRTIDRAVLNDRNELGLILDRSVPLDKIPALMRVMLEKMAHEFPGQDLIVVAYAPSTPPRKIGTAHLDSRTREMTYTAER